MEGVVENGEGGSPWLSIIPNKSPPNVPPPKQGETSGQAPMAFLPLLRKYLAGEKAKGGNLDSPKNPIGVLTEVKDDVLPERVTPYWGVGNLTQVVEKQAIQWNNSPSISTTYNPSTSKTKVVVDGEGPGLAVCETETILADPKFFNDACWRVSDG